MNSTTENFNNSAENIEDNVRKRKRIGNPSQWRRNVVQDKRMKGEEYSGVSNKEITQKPAREMAVACSSPFCAKSFLGNCLNFDNHMLEEIFSKFWKMSWEQKRLYVVSLVSCIGKKRPSSESSNRKQTKTYFYFLALR